MSEDLSYSDQIVKIVKERFEDKPMQNGLVDLIQPQLIDNGRYYSVENRCILALAHLAYLDKHGTVTGGSDKS